MFAPLTMIEETLAAYGRRRCTLSVDSITRTASTETKVAMIVIVFFAENVEDSCSSQPGTEAVQLVALGPPFAPFGFAVFLASTTSFLGEISSATIYPLVFALEFDSQWQPT